MKKQTDTNHITVKQSIRRLSTLGLVFGAALILLLGEFHLLGKTPQLALAQGNGFGAFTHTLSTDFGICNPLNNTIVSDANGGEIRLRATVEDYFNEPEVDTTQWITGTTYNWYTAAQTITNGIITLDANWLRSQGSFSNTERFFESRALMRNNPSLPSARADLGYFRELPPLDPNSVTSTSSIRLVLTGPSGDSNDLIARARDGDSSAPLIDVDLEDSYSTQFSIFRIEWDASETRYYVNGGLLTTITPSILTLNSWVFLYTQEPSTWDGGRSPMEVDWVRAGRYPASGEYVSCPLDAGQPVTWGTMIANVITSTVTGASFSTRTSNNGVDWSDWSSVKGGGAIDNPVGRYLQYRAELTSSDAMQSPEIQQVRINYGDYSLRFYGNGTGDIDRVKIRIDDPEIPADIGVGDFTLEFWMMANSNVNTGTVVCNGNDGWITGNVIIDRDINGDGDYGDFGVSLGNGYVAFGVSQGSTGTTVCSTTRIATTGRWRHIAITRNAGTGEIRIYIDGFLVGQGPGPTGDLSYRNGRTTSYSNDPFLVFGAEKHDDGPAYPSYNGWMDEVRLSNTIRYTAEFTRPTTHFISDENTLALYHFNEGPNGPCIGNILDGSGATGGPSTGACQYGGDIQSGPEYSEENITYQEPTAVTLRKLTSSTASSQIHALLFPSAILLIAIFFFKRVKAR